MDERNRPPSVNPQTFQRLREFVLLTSGLALVMLCVAACGSNGHNGHGWQDYRETYDASVARPGNGGTGPRVRGQWTIVDYDINIAGTLSLYPPPPHTKSNAEQVPPSQSQLTTEQRITVTVRIPDRPGDITSPVQIIEAVVMSQGYAILDGIPARGPPMPGLGHPAVQASHRGEIWIYPGRASHGGAVERLYLESEGQGISLAADAEKDSLLAYDLNGTRSFDRKQRIEELVHWSRAEADRVRQLGELVAVQIFVLDEYRAQRGYGHDDGIFVSADQTRKILRWHTEWRRWEDPALHKYRDELMELFLALSEARDAAWDSRPQARSLGQSAIDAVMVVPHVVESVGAGIVETGRMARDLGTYSADVLGESIGLYDIDWEPWSAVGQAYASGQSTGQIAWSMVDGLSNTVDRALYAANHGDYRPLMNLSGVLTAELLLMRGFVRAARVSRKKTPANATSMGARIAGRYQKTLDQLRALRGQLARARNIPGRVRDELDALSAALGRAIRPQMITAAAGSPRALVDGLADLRSIYAAARLDKARDRTLAILRSRGTLGGASRARALSTIERLERMATTSSASDAVTRVLAYIDTLDRPAAFLRVLDETLTVSARFPADDFAGLLRRAVHTPTPAGYLSDIRWLAELAPEARHALAYRAAHHRAPDLTWLRAADLPRKDLEGLALDPSTNWAQMQRRSLQAKSLPVEVRAVIGKRVDELKEAPPGTEFWTPKKGRRQLRWQRDRGVGHPRLTVDSDMRIVVGGGDDLNRAALGRNMRKLAGKLWGHQDHHIVPIEVTRDHALFRAARTRGKPRWDPNHPDNGIQLPGSAKARAAIADSAGLPIHNSRHDFYSKLTRNAADETVEQLEAKYGSLDRAPPEELTGAARHVERTMRTETLNWLSNHGDKLK